ncbi:MAG: HIT domain-containing protein [Parvularculaceae bacterium]|nr:HIT domain-containing protein [Parvularculaceae bacterium]
MAFTLDEQLANDTTPVGDLPLSTVLLMNDSRFAWAILVPRREGLVELHDMSETDRNRLISESVEVSCALQKLTAASKMNIATLGNLVRQLHVHVIARKSDDEAWPRPVWGVGTPAPYARGQARACADALKAALGV